MTLTLSSDTKTPAVPSAPWGLLGISLFKKTIWLSIGEAVALLSGFLISVLLARTLGKEQYGTFIFVFSTINLFIFLADFGLQQLAARDLAREPSRASEFIRQGLVLKLILAIACFAAVGITTQLLRFSESITLAMFIVLLSMLLNSFSDFFRGIFRGFGRMDLEAGTRILQSLMTLGLVLLVLLTPFSLNRIFWSYVFANVAGLLLTAIFIRRLQLPLGFDLRLRPIRRLLKASWTFALSAVFVMIYYYIDSVMLGIMKSLEVVGWYGATYKLVILLNTLPMIVLNAIFPTLSNSFVQSRETFITLLTRATKFMSALAFPIGVGGTLLAPHLILLFFGQEYQPSQFAFQILVWSVVLLFINAIFGVALSSSNRQAQYLKAVATGALVNVGLNLVFIPRWSLYGAAAATVLTELVIGAIMMKSCFSFIRFPFWASWWKMVLASLIMGGVLGALRSWPLVALLPIGILVYSICTLFFRTFTLQELQTFRSMIFSFHEKHTSSR